MKTKYLLLGIGAVFALGGLWVGRMAWRAHRQLVTLDVRDMPLAEVLRKVERQTWKKIRAEKALDARITLRVTDKPLEYVLDRLGEQAGARWCTLYAVYDSAAALKGLDSALRGDGKLEPAGWTRLAPKLSAPNEMPSNEPGLVFHANPNPEPPGPMPGERKLMMVRRSPDGPVVFSGGAGGQVEMWSPQELVMQSSLTGRLASDHSQAATAESAAETARKLKARWTTCLALRKSNMGIGFAGPPPGRPGMELGRPRLDDRFEKLTPGQRVQRARERLGLSKP
jgi:hypothetical protein